MTNNFKKLINFNIPVSLCKKVSKIVENSTVYASNTQFYILAIEKEVERIEREKEELKEKKGD